MVGTKCTSRISIALATYNGASYLQQQLDSFLEQTRLPDEVILTDDCSTDETPKIIKRFSETAPFEVHWERNEQNLGYTGNFNQALMKTTGDLVFLSDQDDVWFRDKLEQVERYAAEHPAALVLMNDAALTDGELNDTGLTKLGQITSAGLSYSSFVMGCCAAVRRDLLELCLPIPDDYRGHDGWIVKMAEGMGRKRVFTDVLQWYRRHETNESQFIANRIERVSRTAALKHNIQKHVKTAEHHDQAQQTVLQMQRFLEGVRAAQAKAESPFADELLQFAQQLTGRLQTMESRMAIRRRPRLQRLPGVIHLWKSGGYHDFSGAKSALRDIVFR